jgi:trimethylamine monooxygenase
MQEQFFTFSLFDIQATWVRDVILNKIALPSKKDMISDSELWILKEKDLTSSNDKVNFQALYMKDLLRDLDFPYFDIDLVVRNFERMERDKKKRYAFSMLFISIYSF